MAEHSYFFNSIPEDPRSYQATDFANYFKVLTRNGVYKNGNDLEVVADGSTMNTTLKSGSAFIEGYRYDNDSDLELTHGTAEPDYDRIDLIVLRLDRNQSNRYIRAFVKQGTPSENPVAPELIDDGFIKEIAIAEVRVIAGQSYIEQSQITDRRGYILDPITDGTRITQLEENTIVERGSNVNGSYICWENGIQICRNTFQLNVPDFTSFIVYRFTGDLKVYPTEFLETPEVHTSVRGSNYWGGQSTVTEIGYRPVVFSIANTAPTTINFVMTAIGRWK